MSRSVEGDLTSPGFQSAAKIGIGIQVALLVLTLLLLDGGALFRVTGIAALGHLAGIVIVAFRRPLSPTAWDLVFVKFGTPLLMVVASLLTMALGRWSGLTPPPVVLIESVMVLFCVILVTSVRRVLVSTKKRQRLSN